MINVLAFIIVVISLVDLDFVVYSHILGHYPGLCLGLHHGQRHGLHHGQCLGLHHGCHKSCRSWQLCRAVNHDSGRSPARRLRHIMLCHQQEDYDGDDDRDDHRNNGSDDYEDDNEGHGIMIMMLSMMMIIKKMMILKVTMVINFFACVDSVAVKDTGRRDVLERID